METINTLIRAKVDALPDSPGVYRWKDKDGRVIYVGKAVNLKNRVRSYVREDKNRSPKVAAMIRHAADLDITMTATEMEALILECNLIKELHPKYNISLRDDKSYPYVKITVNEKWPRILVTRNIRRDDGAKYFGPFTDVGSLRKTLSLIRRLYPIRTCRSMKVSRPCLQYHMNLCCAPCWNHCTEGQYHEYVVKTCDLFEGKNTELVKALQKDMESASEEMNFERAAVLRDQLHAVQSVQQRQNIVSKEGDFDVVGMSRLDEHAGLEIFYIRYGKMVGKENLSIPDSLHETDEDIIAAFIKNFYGANPSSVPKEIILPILPQESLLLTAWLSKLRNGDVKIYVPERGFKRRLKDMAQSNAAKYLADKKLQWEYQDAREQGAVNKLKELLHLPKLPERIECFDISHNQGAETPGSMVVFESGQTDPIIIDPHEPALQLLQFIRDEAHRFVITYHRKWTTKRNTESILDHIAGIGPQRRNALWHAFRSLDEMRNATVEELTRVKGMNKTAAENVFRFFRMKKDEKRMLVEGFIDGERDDSSKF